MQFTDNATYPGEYAIPLALAEPGVADIEMWTVGGHSEKRRVVIAIPAAEPISHKPLDDGVPVEDPMPDEAPVPLLAPLMGGSPPQRAWSGGVVVRSFRRPNPFRWKRLRVEDARNLASDLCGLCVLWG